MRVNLQNIIKYIILSCSLLFLTEQATAQFTFTNNLRGSQPQEIVVGGGGGTQGTAVFTSGGVDPIGAGWLRLTNSNEDQRGFAYIDKSFPSTMGIMIDFEYKMWRPAENTGIWGRGGDGLSVFLFDATIPDFRLGGWGGSLAYAPNTAQNPQVPFGLAGGYIGVGFDVFGYYAVEQEGRIGSLSGDANNNAEGRIPNTISIRGATTSNSSTTNRLLHGIKLGDRSGTAEDIALRNEVGYNTLTNIRPTDDDFYRRVQIEISPISTGYRVVARWKKSTSTGPFEELISYETQEAPPALLKLGFGASSGGARNNHEIRNLLITTPGNLRVVKRANKDILRSVHAQTGPSNEIEYHIEVINDTPAELDAIDFTDKLTDADGNPIPDGMFDITSITPSGFLANTALPNPSTGSPITTGEFDGTLHLAANATGTITVKGKLNAMPSGNLLVNTTSAFPTTIVDEDLLNNTSVVETPVVSEKSDLVITSEVDESCLVGGGNRFNLTVSNIGVLLLEYGNRTANNNLTVTTTLPSGVSLNNNSFSGTGWRHTSSGNEHTFTRTNGGTLNSGQSLPPISYTLSSNNGYANEVSVSSNGEPIENRDNNTAKSSVNPTPDAPEAIETIYYCLGETAVPLEAEAASGNTLQWYLNEGGVVSNTAFTPSTSTVGSTTYYVSQQADGGCESGLTEITVIVLPETTAGSIAGDQEICSDSTPEILTSADAGTGEGAITYRWESSTDEGQTWTTINGATDSGYQPDAIGSTTSFRRITVATVGTDEAVCESEPTNIVTITTKDCFLITNPMIYQKTQ